MTKENIIGWIRQTAAIRQVVDQIDENLDNLKGNLHVAIAVENTKHQAAAQTDIERFSRDREKILAELLQRVNAPDLESATTRLTDLQIRLELVDSTFEQWRRKLAQYEFIASTDGFKESPEQGITAQQLTEVIDSAKNQYETALGNASALIPNKAVLIHV